MALPKLNDLPKYEITIPSTQKKVFFRPFLVKEQKVLMIAMESTDKIQILKAISDTIAACIEGNVNVSKLATFDVEYLFTQIRAKSVGENTKLGLTCGQCETVNEVTINIDDLKINKSAVNNMVKLNDTITIKMRYPSFASIMNEDFLNNETSGVNQMYEMIVACMDSILTEEDNINLDDETYETKLEFLDQMTSEQFQKIMNFIDNIPKLSHPVEFKCSGCDKENEITLQGINDFFQSASPMKI